MKLLGLRRGGSNDMLREAAWMARCVGRGEWAPLAEADITELGSRRANVELEPGAPLFTQDAPCGTE